MDSPLRVILDTNLWISYLISNRMIALDILLKEGRIKLIFSEELLEEFIKVAERPKFRKYFSEDDMNELLELIGHFGELVEVISEVKICRDSKDDFLLSLAIDGQVDYLVTGDRDLLVLERINSTQIVAFSNFKEIIG